MIPSTVKIAGQIMQVLFDNHLASSEDRHGECDSMRGRIVIDSIQPLEMKESTFLHEIIEKINKDNELDLEHKQITALGTQLHQVLRDNNISFYKEGE